MWHSSLLDLIGNTPLVQLNNTTEGLAPTILAKVEYFNPGGSVKDRIGIKMIDAAEAAGILEPGGTIIEATSGNTGLGLAIVAALRSYRCIFTIPDKQSREKVSLLKAFGAEVLVCPTAVSPQDSQSYYSVAQRLSEEIPNSFYPNQHYNPNNPQAHYETTGPEIWEQTEGKITHFVCGLGTGGTVTGVGRYLKEQNPDIQVIGVDPVGSLYLEYFNTGKLGEAQTYKVEGIGEDIIPGTIDFQYIDEVIPVSDKESFLAARQLCREEGIFSGGSAGSAIAAAFKVARSAGEDAVMVVLLPDHGSRYLSKVFNDEWMRENQFLEPRMGLKARDLVTQKETNTLRTISAQATAAEALSMIKRYEISQIPVTRETRMVGSIREDQLIDLLMRQENLDQIQIQDVMADPLPVLTGDTSVERIRQHFQTGAPAVLVETGNSFDIVTKFDLIHTL